MDLLKKKNLTRMLFFNRKLTYKNIYKLQVFNIDKR